MREERGEELARTWHAILRDQLVDENAAEINDCRDDASVFGSGKHGLEEDDLAENRLSIDKEEDPYVHGIRIVDDLEEENEPGERRHEQVDAGIEGEPGEPVWEISHAHNSHSLFGARFLLSHNFECHVVNWRDECQQKEERQKQA